MARKPREKSRSGTYHVMLRGVNRQIVFFWPDDYQHFMTYLLRARDTTTAGEPVSQPNFQVYAYCLMDNHVHLLLHLDEEVNSIGDVVRRLSTAYAVYFNRKYERVGHLFQDRFRSEPCDSAEYLNTLYSYIHLNPVKAGLCAAPADYEWSSYRELVGLQLKKTDSLCSSPREVFGIDPNLFCDPDAFLPVKLGEEEDRANVHSVEERILELSSCKTLSEFLQLDKAYLRTVLAVVRDEGVSVAQLNRVTGCSRAIIRKARILVPLS